MSQNSKTLFRTEFIDVLMNTQDEAERLGIGKVYDIFILKNLINSSRSQMKDFFQFVGAKWENINKAIQKQINLYLKENNISTDGEDEDEEENVEDKKGDESKVVSTETDLIDWELLKNYAKLSGETMQTISNAAYYSYDGDYLGEIEYLLALFEEGFNTYVEGFFRLIQIDTRLVNRYF